MYTPGRNVTANKNTYASYGVVFPKAGTFEQKRAARYLNDIKHARLTAAGTPPTWASPTPKYHNFCEACEGVDPDTSNDKQGQPCMACAINTLSSYRMLEPRASRTETRYTIKTSIRCFTPRQQERAGAKTVKRTEPQTYTRSC